MKYRESLNIVNKDLQLPAILAINSSINAEESLSRVFEVLQDFLDADGAFVNIFDVQKHSIVFVRTADEMALLLRWVRLNRPDLFVRSKSLTKF